MTTIMNEFLRLKDAGTARNRLPLDSAEARGFDVESEVDFDRFIDALATEIEASFSSCRSKADFAKVARETYNGMQSWEVMWVKRHAMLRIAAIGQRMNAAEG